MFRNLPRMGDDVGCHTDIADVARFACTGSSWGSVGWMDVWMDGLRLCLRGFSLMSNFITSKRFTSLLRNPPHLECSNCSCNRAKKRPFYFAVIIITVIIIAIMAEICDMMTVITLVTLFKIRWKRCKYFTRSTTQRKRGNEYGWWNMWRCSQ